MYRIHVVGCSPRTGTTLLAEMMVACSEIDLHSEHEEHPGAVPALEAALRILPRLHVVVMLRDPRDIVASRHRADRERYWAALNYWKTFLTYIRRLQKHPRVTVVRPVGQASIRQLAKSQAQSAAAGQENHSYPSVPAQLVNHDRLHHEFVGLRETSGLVG